MTTYTPVATLRDRVFEGFSSVIGRHRTKFLFKIYDLARFDLFGRPWGNFGSIDITCRCNLHCKHCYFMEQGYDSELSEEQWFQKFDEWRRNGFPFYQCSWVGGEPLLRKDLVAKGMKYFKSNVIATNGTIPLPDWPDVNFYVSVDGTAEYYRQMRGRDFYERIKKNADRPDLKVVASMVVAKNNYHCIPDLLAEWSRTAVKGIMFQFYTPIRGHTDDLWPGFELRDRILDDLLRYKKIYGDFIDLPESLFRLMKSDRCKPITANCLYRTQAFCYDPMGRVKRPCMMGPKADCSRCGCVLPFHLHLLESRSLMFREMMMAMGRKLKRAHRFSRESRIGQKAHVMRQKDGDNGS
ncbi:MAG: radical SAM protein [Planctomycetota bacterium]